MKNDERSVTVEISGVAPKAAGCPDDERLAAFVDDALPPKAREAIEAHIDGCDACTALLVGFARVYHPSIGGGDDTLAAQSEPAPSSLPPGARIARYEILERIGRGGMGVVYLAHDTEMHRDVAVKLVNKSEGPDDAGARMRTEARALARLEHPNVVSVYDVGTFSGHVYVAMEYVVGATLREWLLLAERTLDDKLAVFRQAAAGLAAAHDAGVVHRDFKPANVMVGDDGRVRVVDFGLARLERRTPRERRAKESEPPRSLTGRVVGTPRYMAPEQRAGEAVDARSDQYAFAVALYEAVYAQAPRDVSELPRTPRLSRRLQRALTMALAKDPARRNRDMHALEAALGPVVDAGRRVWLAGGAVAVAAVLGATVAFALRKEAPASICYADERVFDGVWDAPLRDEIHGAFAATGVGHAEATFERVAAALDGYRVAWLEERARACSVDDASQAARPARRGDASGELWRACLDTGRAEVRAYVRMLTQADAGMVNRALMAAGDLARPGDCAARRNAAAFAPRSPEYQAIERDLATVRTLGVLGQLDEAAKEAPRVVERARSLGDGPLLAQTLHRLGLIRAMIDDIDGAEQALTESARVGDESGADAERVIAYAGLAQLEGMRGEPARGLRWLEVAEGARLRAGTTPELELTILSVRADLLGQLARFEESLREHERAYAVAIGVHGPEGYRTGVELADLAAALHERGRHEEARSHFRHAIEILRAALSSTHPYVGQVLLNAALEDGGTLDPATAAPVIAMAREGHQILTSQLKPDHSDHVWAHIMLAAVLSEAGACDEARPLAEAAYARAREVLGDDDMHTHNARIVLACCLIPTPEHRPEARTLLRAAIDHLRATAGRLPDPSLGRALLELGRLERSEDHFEAAEAAFEESRTIFAALSPTHQRARHAAELRDEARTNSRK